MNAHSFLKFPATDQSNYYNGTYLDCKSCMYQHENINYYLCSQLLSDLTLIKGNGLVIQSYISSLAVVSFHTIKMKLLAI